MPAISMAESRSKKSLTTRGERVIDDTLLLGTCERQEAPPSMQYGQTSIRLMLLMGAFLLACREFAFL